MGGYNQFEMKLEERYKSLNPIINKIHKKSDLRFKIQRIEEAIDKLQKLRRNTQLQRDRLEDDIDKHIITYGNDFMSYVPKEK